jgi:hypothetical protein
MMLVAVVVLPEETAVWSDFKKSVILSPTLELLLLLEEELGALARMFVSKLEASDVSPACKSVSTVASAFSSGFPDEDAPVGACGGGFAAR